MRWIYLVLGLVGMMALMKSFVPHFWATPFYTVPGINIGLTWGFSLILLFVLMGAAKLKFGK